MRIQHTSPHRYSLKNVRLETEFIRENDEIVGTQTDLFTIDIAGTTIDRIRPNNPTADAIDAKSCLLLPSFRDMHAHLDKTLFGLPWQAITKSKRTVRDMIAMEQQLIPELLKTSTERAEKLIRFLQSYGTGFSRSHFNIEPTSGLTSLEHLLTALENIGGSFGAELVAFPQHGIYYTDTAPLLAEAAKLPAVNFVGGLDPFSIDGSIEKPLDFIIQLALENNKGIDIHLHETGESGIRTMQYLVDRVLENPELQGRTFVSHAFVLAHLTPVETQEIAERLAAAQIGIASSVPLRGHIMPIPTLLKYGVDVLIGNDNIQDHWGTFGSGNMLQKMQLIAELYGSGNEYDLSRTLALATGGLIPLDSEGTQQWPKAGAAADMILVDASCSAEAVSRISPIRSLIYQGRLVF
ncbi:amidohydrolase [Sphingobacterium suaedae]|uniref:Amidohydrolase n=1 Tax=Sphingobacterium suaedae TaxID=1686402 RepID=A0ABW5KBZ5_9SPHI